MSNTVKKKSLLKTITYCKIIFILLVEVGHNRFVCLVWLNAALKMPLFLINNNLISSFSIKVDLTSSI